MIGQLRRAVADCLRVIANHIDEGEGMIEVAIAHNDSNLGKVASSVSTAYIVCRRHGPLDWEPLYAEKKASGERVELPHCFELRTDLTAALEAARGS